EPGGTTRPQYHGFTRICRALGIEHILKASHARNSLVHGQYQLFHVLHFMHEPHLSRCIRAPSPMSKKEILFNTAPNMAVLSANEPMATTNSIADNPIAMKSGRSCIEATMSKDKKDVGKPDAKGVLTATAGTDSAEVFGLYTIMDKRLIGCGWAAFRKAIGSPISHKLRGSGTY
ncbi:MAG: hypothetical protein Q9218_005349, partial [Villophora microphyllina]